MIRSPTLFSQELHKICLANVKKSTRVGTLSKKNGFRARPSSLIEFFVKKSSVTALSQNVGGISFTSEPRSTREVVASSSHLGRVKLSFHQGLRVIRIEKEHIHTILSPAQMANLSEIIIQDIIIVQLPRRTL